MKSRYVIGGLIVLVFLGIGGYSFLSSSVEYATISRAERTGKRVQVTGVPVPDMESRYDAKSNTFTFYMKDDESRIARVVLAGAKPNNFDIATSIVARGRYEEGVFNASEVLTKCPSKYDGKDPSQHPDGARKSSM